MLREAQLLS
jgi:hypothetical protein